MKKILVSLFIILFSGVITITILGMQKNVLDEYYSIEEYKGFVIDEDRDLWIEFYSKNKSPKFLVIEDTTFLYELEQESFTLKGVEISSFDLGDYYLFKLKASMPNISQDEVTSNTSTLKIITTGFSLELSLGPVSFLKASKYKLLSLNELYASYSYYNGILYITGLNISLSNTYSSMRSIRFGEYLYGNLSHVEFDMKYNTILDSSIAKNYNLKNVLKEYSLALSSNTLFIPIGHKKLSLFRSGYVVLELDGEFYYIDTFLFMSNSYDPVDYENCFSKGVCNA